MNQYHRYRLSLRASNGGATIRASAVRTAPIRGYVRGGDYWWGTPAVGGTMAVPGFVSSRIWIVNDQGFAVWAGMLDQIHDGS